MPRRRISNRLLVWTDTRTDTRNSGLDPATGSSAKRPGRPPNPVSAPVPQRLRHPTAEPSSLFSPSQAQADDYNDHDDDGDMVSMASGELEIPGTRGASDAGDNHQDEQANQEDDEDEDDSDIELLFDKVRKSFDTHNRQ
jgi:hypothetical protein